LQRLNNFLTFPAENWGNSWRYAEYFLSLYRREREILYHALQVKNKIMNKLDDGTVETYQELKSDRDRLHNIYIQQSLEIRDLRARLKEVNNLITK